MKLFCFLPLVSYVITSTIITTEDIMQMIKKEKTKYDPDGKKCYMIANTTKYITKNEWALLYQLEKEAKSMNHFDYVFVIVESIPYNSSNPAKKFTENLQNSMSNANYIIKTNSIVILFAMADRQFSIKTGLSVQSTFSDSRVEKYLNLIKNDLANQKYYKAYSTLLGYFRDNYNPPSPSPSPSSGGDSKVTAPMVIGGLAVIVVCFTLIYLCNRFCPSVFSSSSSSNTDSATYDYPNAPLYSDNYNPQPPKHHHHPPKPKPAPKSKGAKAHGGGASGGW